MLLELRNKILNFSLLIQEEPHQGGTFKLNIERRARIAQ